MSKFVVKVLLWITFLAIVAAASHLTGLPEYILFLIGLPFQFWGLGKVNEWYGIYKLDRNLIP